MGKKILSEGKMRENEDGENEHENDFGDLTAAFTFFMLQLSLRPRQRREKFDTSPDTRKAK